MQKAAITGASGFIGSYLAAELLGRGFGVCAVVRETSDLSLLESVLVRQGYSLSSLDIRCVDIMDEPALSAVFGSVDVVFNCAAWVSFDSHLSAEIIAVNTDIAMTVVDACLSSHRPLVHVSSIAALGSVKYPDLITEDTIFDSVEKASGYGISKFYSENEVWRGMHEGLRAIIVNPSVVLGLGGDSESLFDLRLPFYTDGVTGYVDVRDVVRAMVDLYESDLAWGDRYILSASNMSYRELFIKIAAAQHRRAPMFRANGLMLHIGRLLMALSAAVRGRRSPITKDIISTSLKCNAYDGSRIEKLINFKYRSIDATISYVVESH